MEEQNIFVRRASLADLDQIVPLFDAYRQFYGQAHNLALAREFLRERLEQDQSVIFLALGSSGSAAGFTQLYPSFSSASVQRIFILNDLFVDPAVRRSGGGTGVARSGGGFRTQRRSGKAHALDRSCQHVRAVAVPSNGMAARRNVPQLPSGAGTIISGVMTARRHLSLLLKAPLTD
jgi:hypothetical protein